MELATGHFGHASIVVAVLAVFLSSVHTTDAPSSSSFLSPSANTSPRVLSTVNGKSGSRSCEHLFPCSKVNFSSLFLRQASRIMPTSRGFDGSLFSVLRTCENKNIAFLGRETDAALFTRLKENFRNIFAKCSLTKGVRKIFFRRGHDSKCYIQN